MASQNPIDHDTTVRNYVSPNPPPPPPLPTPVAPSVYPTANPSQYQPLPALPPRFASVPPSLPSQQPAYSALPGVQYSSPSNISQSQPYSYYNPNLTLPPKDASHPVYSAYKPPVQYPEYPPTISSQQKPLSYTQWHPPYEHITYNPGASADTGNGAGVNQSTNTYQYTAAQELPDPYSQTTYPAPPGLPDPSSQTWDTANPSQNAAPQATLSLQSATIGDTFAQVLVQDGEDPQAFASARTLTNYLQTFPEADNDQGCRIFKYGPKCPAGLLMPLFEHFDFSRYSTFPYGFAGDYSIADHWGAGSCNCQKCFEGQLCGHYVLQKNFHFYIYQDVTPTTSTSSKVLSNQDALTISTGNSQFSFRRADWNLQSFRFRSRRNQTTVFAFDALVYQNYESDIKLKSSSLDYILTQLDVILKHWESLLNAATQFLLSFRVEVLEERLETDRSIIRNLLIAAQHWEEFRRVLQAQLQRLEFFENIHGDPRWTEGRDNYYELLATTSAYLQKFRALDYRITTELMQETDNLVQRVTNLITIDEGYRSRDQNESIRRLTWITFIFLPLIFTAGIFSMQVDLLTVNPKWQYYIYTSLVLMFLIFSAYTLLRSRRRLGRLGLGLAFWALTKLTDRLRKAEDGSRTSDQPGTSIADLEKQGDSSTDEIHSILKWAASSGRTDIIRNILQTSTKKSKTTPGISGQALVMAIRNGHIEAANLLISTGEGVLYTDESKATVLHWAAKMGQSSMCQQLLQNGVPLDAKDQNEQTALDWAMRGDDETTINILLKGGKSFTRQETANLQSLHFSARTGDIEVIKEFHKQGSSLEARDSKGQTVLFHAVKGGQHQIVTWLAEEGQANVQAVDKEGLTALHVAAHACDTKSAEILLRQGANVNALSSKNATPVHCIPNSKGVPILRLLHDKGADVNAVDKDSNRIVHKSATTGDSASSLFKVAGDLGADLDSPGANGNTPAHLAAESGSKAILGVLTQNKVEFETTRNVAGHTPLMTACRAAKIEVVHLLLDKGVSFSVVDSDGRSLLELSIGWGNPDVIATLKEYGADFTNVTAASGTVHPVWKAVSDGHGASVAQILDGGLSIEYEHRGVRLLQLAIETDNVEVVNLLVERNAAVDVADVRGWTALHSAAYSGNVSVLLLILQRTDDKEPLDQQGWTPLDLAAFYKHDEIMKVLDPTGKVKIFAWEKTGRIRINATSYHIPPVADSIIPGIAEASGG